MFYDVTILSKIRYNLYIYKSSNTINSGLVRYDVSDIERFSSTYKNNARDDDDDGYNDDDDDDDDDDYDASDKGDDDGDNVAIMLTATSTIENRMIGTCFLMILHCVRARAVHNIWLGEWVQQVSVSHSVNIYS